MSHKGYDPGEWQEEINTFGGVHRFRMVGNVKEYEPTIMTSSGGDMTRSQLEAFNLQQEQEKRDRMKITPPPAPAWCPFMSGGTSCKRDGCGLYSGDGCALADHRGEPAIDTRGKKCPFNPYQCREECGLYKNGCLLTARKERV